MKLNFKLDGLKEFKKNLEQYTEGTEDKIKDLVVETTLDIESDAISRTPVGDVNGGNLKSSWFTKLYGLTGEISNSAEYAVHVEYGTAPHVIRPKSSRYLVFNGDNGKVFTKQVNHPGTKAQPMLGPAMQKVENEYYKQLSRILAGD